jgi:hypothetical protein
MNEPKPAYYRNVVLELFEVVYNQPLSEPHATVKVESCDPATVPKIIDDLLRIADCWNYPAEVRVSYTACE